MMIVMTKGAMINIHKRLSTIELGTLPLDHLGFDAIVVGNWQNLNMSESILDLTANETTVLNREKIESKIRMGQLYKLKINRVY